MPIKTPICDFGQTAKSFELKSTNNEIIKLNDVKGTNELWLCLFVTTVLT